MYKAKQFFKKNSEKLLSRFPTIPLFLLKKLLKKALILPYYHIVSDREVPHVKHLYSFRNTTQFRDDLDFFLKNYSPLSLADLLERLKNDNSAPETAFHLTFDDGFSEQYGVVAPTLKEKGIPATFFLVSDFLDNKKLFYRHKASILVENLKRANGSKSRHELARILSKYGVNSTDFESAILSVRYEQKGVLDEIAPLLNVDFAEYLTNSKPYLTSPQVSKLVEDGFTIGAHGVDHRMYTSLSLKDQLYQTRESVDVITKCFSLEYRAFAFPHLDSGVSRGYFDAIFSNGYVDISFGTSGMIEDVYHNNLQRFPMEKTKEPAEIVIAREYVSKLARIVLRRDKIKRVR